MSSSFDLDILERMFIILLQIHLGQKKFSVKHCLKLKYTQKSPAKPMLYLFVVWNCIRYSFTLSYVPPLHITIFHYLEANHIYLLNPLLLRKISSQAEFFQALQFFDKSTDDIIYLMITYICNTTIESLYLL